MRKLLILFGVFILQVSVFAKVTPGRDSINAEPLTWEIDIYDEFQKDAPGLSNQKIYYIAVEPNNFFNTKNADLSSIPGKISIQRPGMPRTNFRPEGQLANRGDVITLAYNQNLKVYIPYLHKTIWISPSRQKKVKFYPTDVSDDKAALSSLAKSIDPEKKVVFKLTPDQQKNNDSAEPAVAN